MADEDTLRGNQVSSRRVSLGTRTHGVTLWWVFFCSVRSWQLCSVCISVSFYICLLLFCIFVVICSAVMTVLRLCFLFLHLFLLISSTFMTVLLNLHLVISVVNLCGCFCIIKSLSFSFVCLLHLSLSLCCCFPASMHDLLVYVLILHQFDVILHLFLVIFSSFMTTLHRLCVFVVALFSFSLLLWQFCSIHVSLCCFLFPRPDISSISH